jgi:hypothetical protein
MGVLKLMTKHPGMKILAKVEKAKRLRPKQGSESDDSTTEINIL